jgi:hypothetical protein
VEEYAYTSTMGNLRLKSNIFSSISVVILTYLIPLLSCGCQVEKPLTISEGLDTPSPMATIEVPTPQPEISTMIVPLGKPLNIDGTMSQGEWDNAKVEKFPDGSELFLMDCEGYLYLGIRASTTEMIVGNILIDRGDEIAILHSSAALGTAIYRKVTESWQRSQDFVWFFRKTDNSEIAQAERDAFLKQEHWIAANALMGIPNELEYQIKTTDETQRMAVIFIRSSNPDMKIPWPNDLDDDCIMPTVGGLPAQMHFAPEKWETIGIPYSES